MAVSTLPEEAFLLLEDTTTALASALSNKTLAPLLALCRPVLEGARDTLNQAVDELAEDGFIQNQIDLERVTAAVITALRSIGTEGKEARAMQPLRENLSQLADIWKTGPGGGRPVRIYGTPFDSANTPVEVPHYVQTLGWLAEQAAEVEAHYRENVPVLRQWLEPEPGKVSIKSVAVMEHYFGLLEPVVKSLQEAHLAFQGHMEAYPVNRNDHRVMLPSQAAGHAHEVNKAMLSLRVTLRDDFFLMLDEATKADGIALPEDIRLSLKHWHDVLVALVTFYEKTPDNGNPSLSQTVSSIERDPTPYLWQGDTYAPATHSLVLAENEKQPHVIALM